MPMLRICSTPGCKTLTLGEFCVEHEAPVAPAARYRTPSSQPRRPGRTSTSDSVSPPPPPSPGPPPLRSR